MTTTTAQGFPQDDDGPLAAFGLSDRVFHDGLRAGAFRAASRTSLAMGTSAGTDIYHDGMEGLAQILAPAGWRPALIERQPRLVHPEGIVSFAVSSAVNVGIPMQTPRTRKKGVATRKSLAVSAGAPTLFDTPDAEDAEFSRLVDGAPFYFLLFERVTTGPNGLRLEFARPSEMTDGGSVVDWRERIPVPFLELEGDLTVFDDPGDDEYDVDVEPR